MKHTDLMLNDLVMYQGKILRVGCISDYDIKIDLFQDGEDTPYAEIWQEELDEVKPIPLTTDILEKNGWRNVVSDDETPVMQIETHCDAFWWDSIKGECGCERSVYDNGEECIEKTFFCKGICYVHELQRALRCCGVDKEIVL